LFRSGVYDGVRQAFGIPLNKWANAAKEYFGKTPQQAQEENLKSTKAEVDGQKVLVLVLGQSKMPPKRLRRSMMNKSPKAFRQPGLKSKSWSITK